MPKRTGTTIRDIAREAGVSVSTVSRVLNNPTLVDEAKRSAVEQAIATLNYQPNAVAQGLARGTSTTVGVLTQDITSPFYGLIMSGVEQGLHGSPYQPIFASGYWQTDRELEALDVLTRRQIDGLIVIGGQLPDAHLLAIAERVPLIAVGRTISGMEQNCLQVENFEGSYKATRYLINLGHRQIAHIAGIPSHLDAVERREGYCKALRDAGIEIHPDLIIDGGFTEWGGLDAIEALLTGKTAFTAIVTANDQMAYGVLVGLFRHRLRVPEDISVVGFDNQFHTAYTTPPLTTVAQPTVDMGIAAAKALLDVMQGRPLHIPKFPTKLIIRESVTAYRGNLSVPEKVAD